MKSIDLYTCKRVFSLLDDYLDRELNSEQIQNVQAHLATCKECAGEYKFEAQFIQSVREKVARIHLPSSLLERVTDALASAQFE